MNWVPQYSYKALEELAWAALTAAGVVLLQALLVVDPTTITDWRAWAIGLGAACIRAGAGAVLAALGSTKGPPRVRSVRIGK